MKLEKYIIDIILPILLCVFIAFNSSDITYNYPEFIHEIYDEPLYKLLIILCIILLSKHNFLLGLLMMIVVVFIFSDYSMLSEGFAGPNLNDCNIYDTDKINYTGTAFYPLSGDDENQD